MAVFCNQATISYGGVVRQSNVACGELVETVRMTKTALIGTYVSTTWGRRPIRP